MKLKNIIRSEWFWLILIVLAGAFLRFWNLSSWQHLTYDQSRDYIILKRLVVDHKFTLVGPTVSIAPGFFLPPFYYYSLIPFIKLFNFHIVGPDVYTALFGVLSIILYFVLSRDFVGKAASLATTLAFALNPYLIHTSRHAWNPNTLIFFILLFALSFERYLVKKNRKYFILAGFALGWSIGLHLTAIVFLPLFFYLMYKEFFKYKIGITSLIGIILFLITFSPLFLFDIRHGFPITKAGLSYLQKQKQPGRSDINKRLGQAAIDFYKMPSIFLSGIYQKENLTVRPSNITSFNSVKLFSTVDSVERLKIIGGMFIWLFSVFTIFITKATAKGKILLFFLSLGLLIRLCFPTNLFYFYYYLAVFPFIYLMCGLAIDKSKEINSIFPKILIILILILSVSGLWPRGIYAEPKAESYFLPVCEIIARDYNISTKAAVALNVGDVTRWEHNGLEYRYFLESLFKIPLGNWEASDYKSADVLYFIDEGNVPNPLKFGGMEVEAFKPTKIVQKWQVQTGQKIYKMTR